MHFDRGMNKTKNTWGTANKDRESKNPLQIISIRF